ncbi:MAG TPA: hypothetical protein PLU71_03705 [Candidatus Dependentiae bacterium]|nr:hypothetical protein [Candidatus Dependentiae bacterium]HRQ62937.1 hypothetical protein [Candidatus Dependentiae bacterium]
MSMRNKFITGILIINCTIPHLLFSTGLRQQESEGYGAQFTSAWYWQKENYKNTKWWATCGVITGSAIGLLWYFLTDRRTPEQVYEDACNYYDEVFNTHNKHICLFESAYHITSLTEHISTQEVDEELLKTFAVLNLSTWSWYDNTIDYAMNRLQKQIDVVQERILQLKSNTQDNALCRNMHLFVERAKKLHIRLRYVRNWYKYNRPYFTLHNTINRLLDRYSDNERSAQYSVQQLQVYIEQLRSTHEYPYIAYMQQIESDIYILKLSIDNAQYAAVTTLMDRARLLYKDLVTIQRTLQNSGVFNRMAEQERAHKRLQEEIERLHKQRKQLERERIQIERERLRQERERQELEKSKLEQTQRKLEQERQRVAQQQVAQQHYDDFAPSAPPMTQDEYAAYYAPSAPPMEEHVNS